MSAFSTKKALISLD